MGRRIRSRALHTVGRVHLNWNKANDHVKDVVGVSALVVCVFGVFIMTLQVMNVGVAFDAAAILLLITTQMRPAIRSLGGLLAAGLAAISGALITLFWGLALQNGWALNKDPAAAGLFFAFLIAGAVAMYVQWLQHREDTAAQDELTRELRAMREQVHALETALGEVPRITRSSVRSWSPWSRRSRRQPPGVGGYR